MPRVLRRGRAASGPPSAAAGPSGRNETIRPGPWAPGYRRRSWAATIGFPRYFSRILAVIDRRVARLIFSRVGSFRSAGKVYSRHEERLSDPLGSGELRRGIVYRLA